MDACDASILNEFFEESEELLNSLEDALLSLERDPAEADSLETALRALHTIKGNASFLNVPEIVSLAHAGESALAAMRDGLAALDVETLEALLETGAALRANLARLRCDEALAPPDAALLARLQAHPVTSTPASAETARAGDEERETPDLALSEHRMAVLDAAVADFSDSLDVIGRALETSMRQPAQRKAALAEIRGACGGMSRTAQFLGLTTFEKTIDAIRRAAESSAELDDHSADAPSIITPLISFARRQVDELAARREPSEPPPALLEPIDGPSPARPVAGASAPSRELRSVRVDVDRLEALLDLVGELVIQKNSVARLVQPCGPLADAPKNLREIVLRLSEDLDRLTGDLQHATMRVRMQPLSTLFGRYPRLLRDLANEAGKDVVLEIDGADTEVDRSIIEGLGESMVHLLRNSVDHGVESPSERKRAGKPETGVIRIAAAPSGEHAVIRVSDDGRGMNRERLLRKAIERGILAAHEAHALSDQDAFLLALAPGFSTAAEVSTLSGRGVGMDVVRRSVERLGGSVQIESTPGAGTDVTIRVPLTIAIVGALTVGVGPETYAIPLPNVVEARRLGGGARTEDMPEISLAALLETPRVDGDEDRFAVVVEQHGRRAALLVSELRGRVEVVAKPLSRVWASAAPFSAAAIDADGEVILVLDVARTLELAARPLVIGSASEEGAP